MTLYAPAYYKDFSCIADKCRHSCCIGWEIDIDGETAKKYAACTEVYGEHIRASIEAGAPPHFRLGSGERCPHLDEQGLCRIITSLGDGYLCDICREHPRFYHSTVKGCEVGLGMACEEACRLILTCSEPAILPIGETEEEALPTFDTASARDRIYATLFDTALPYTDRLCKIARMYDISLSRRTEGDWRALFSSLEYLHEEHRALFSLFRLNAVGNEEILSRALAYFIFRHASPAESEDELRAAVGFALLCERLLASMMMAGKDPFESARILSEELEYSEENTEEIKFQFFL